MKKLILIMALMNGSLAFGYSEPGGTAAGSTAAVQNDEQQEIVVEAWRRDRALDAFLRGDYATAEVEFRKNERCIRRIALQLEASIVEGLVEADRSSLPRASNIPSTYNLPLRPDQIRERTCHNKEWQLYMIGLSQIQLGRFAEAKKSLYSVTRMSKEDLLFDAHYRVGLLELLEGDVESANRRLTHLTHMQRSCQSRGARCEVNADLEAATSYLTRAVANARQGVVR